MQISFIERIHFCWVDLSLFFKKSALFPKNEEIQDLAGSSFLTNKQLTLFNRDAFLSFSFPDIRLRCILLEQIPSLFPDLLRLKVLKDRPLWLLISVLLQSLAQENEEVSFKATVFMKLNIIPVSN